MISPTNIREQQLINDDFHIIAGIDEAGRGAWAGPLVAAAVIYNPEILNLPLRDSKKLTMKMREKLYIELASTADYGVGMVWPAELDAKGVIWSNGMALKRAVD